MSKHNPTQRARDLKRENATLRADNKELIEHLAFMQEQLRSGSRIAAWRFAEERVAAVRFHAERKVRNHRILSGLLVLAVLAVGFFNG